MKGHTSQTGQPGLASILSPQASLMDVTQGTAKGLVSSEAAVGHGPEEGEIGGQWPR